MSDAKLFLMNSGNIFIVLIFIRAQIIKSAVSRIFKNTFIFQVFQSDGSFVSKFGVMGSKPGNLEHPHYIAVSNTNRVIVSDSNNHRIQIFDVNGKVLTTFGSEGTDAGQFKFPR